MYGLDTSQPFYLNRHAFSFKLLSSKLWCFMIIYDDFSRYNFVGHVKCVMVLMSYRSPFSVLHGYLLLGLPHKIGLLSDNSL